MGSLNEKEPSVRLGEGKNPLRGTCLDPERNRSDETGKTQAGAFTPPVHGGRKPEHMTSLYRNVLVRKDHPLIAFRGRMDSLEAKILEAQLAFRKLGKEHAVSDLQEALDYVRELLRGEVKGCEVREPLLLGMKGDELRERSHEPARFYGRGHFAAGIEHGEEVILLNSLRTKARETELSAYDAFKDEGGTPSRPDIIRGLNRLSSLFYVMMFKALAKEYES